jgi:hypothetical protein
MGDKVLQDIVFAPILTIIFGLICYWRLNVLRRGRPLTSFMRVLLVCLCLFALGMTYAILFQDGLAALLHWKEAWLAAILGLAAVLTLFAWRKIVRE